MAGRGNRGKELRPSLQRAFQEAARRRRLWNQTHGYANYWSKLIGENPAKAMQMYIELLPKNIEVEHDGEVTVTWQLSQFPTPQDPNNLSITGKPQSIDSTSQCVTVDGEKPSRRSTT